MFRIGDFSRIARVSARLLRFYDEIGLLAPARADPSTGYRYYAIEQLGTLNRILVLKSLGLSLEEIAPILASQVGPEQLRAMLELRQADARREMAEQARRLREIELRIAQIELEGRMDLDDVIVRAEPARLLLSRRQTLASFAEVGQAIVDVRARARQLLGRAMPSTLMAIGHALRFELDALDVELGYVVERAPSTERAAREGLSIRELEAVPRMAVCVRVGHPETAHLTTARIGHYLAAHGDRLDGPGRECFLRQPDADRLDTAIVEMQFPLAARETGEAPPTLGHDAG